MENTNDLDAMTGIPEGGGSMPKLDLLSLNGDAEIVETSEGYKPKGGYYRLLKLTTAKKDEKPEEERLGEQVSVVFLKVRRALQARNSDKVVMHTSEHNTADDTVELHFEGRKDVEVGTARSLREKYESLRTIQYVYGLLLRSTKEPQLVKMRFKGSALGSDAKADGVRTFYDYIYATRTNEDGSKKHLRHIETILGAVKEQGKKTYYTVTFTQGRDLTPELCTIADTELRGIHTKIAAADEARARRMASKGITTTVAEPIEDDAGVVDYPTAEQEGIDTDKIDF